MIDPDPGSIPEGGAVAPRIYWPAEAAHEVTLAAFVTLFEMLGYVAGADETVETFRERLWIVFFPKVSRASARRCLY